MQGNFEWDRFDRQHLITPLVSPSLFGQIACDAAALQHAKPQENIAESRF
jgi:hypothetical protein